MLWYKGEFSLNVVMNVLEAEIIKEMKKKKGEDQEDENEKNGVDKVLVPFGERMRDKIRDEIIEQARNQIERETEKKMNMVNAF